MKLLRLIATAMLAVAIAFAAVPAQKKQPGKSGQAAGQGKTTTTKMAAAGDKEKGKDVYKANCAVCHYADKTDKRIGPGLKGLYKKAKMDNGKPVNDAKVREIIMEGYGKMMPFKEKLDKQQLEDLMAYTRTL